MMYNYSSKGLLGVLELRYRYMLCHKYLLPCFTAFTFCFVSIEGKKNLRLGVAVFCLFAEQRALLTRQIFLVILKHIVHADLLSFYRIIDRDA